MFFAVLDFPIQRQVFDADQFFGAVRVNAERRKRDGSRIIRQIVKRRLMACHHPDLERRQGFLSDSPAFEIRHNR